MAELSRDERMTLTRLKVVMEARCLPAVAPPHQQDLKNGLALVQRLRDEIDYWRAETAARVLGALAEYEHHQKEGRPQEAVAVKVALIDPALAALRDADARRFHETCVGCEQPMRHGQWAIHYEEGEVCHFDCEHPDEEAVPTDAAERGVRQYEEMFRPEECEAIFARARALDNEPEGNS